MPTGNSVFKELEPEEKLPEYLKAALVSEVDTIRNSMLVVTHFTEHFFSAVTACLSVPAPDESSTN
ncbi:hypothetical protein DYBT9275_04352 [Dyadobacter sp. CECT 9275]|uniref:Uncharacterized protein n=1 Tax=Dyadobacter helix TaxID=2822344 RepID=A0A916JJ04_9BACT|nr:hypothetical protein DYBT9275_04352 [Dyadobacter sp. CECT 9275]